MEKISAEKVLEKLITLLISYLDELFDYKDVDDQQFQYGERTAYTECLEWIQDWEYAELYGLNFDVEQKYPL